MVLERLRYFAADVAPMSAIPADVLTFWRNAGPAKWFAKSQAFDDAIRLRFEPVHHAAARGQYAAWEQTADGALALILLLDQFPRNLYRGSAHAFATDPLARSIARLSVEAGYPLEVEAALKSFFFLPFVHSEEFADQERAITLYEAAGDTDGLKWARIHRDIIARFGRFPHRNASLGRVATVEEKVFLAEGGFAG
jgi:uncharacterized protein (DUF924 family)